MSKLTYNFIGRNSSAWHLFYMMMRLGMLNQNETSLCIESITERHEIIKKVVKHELV